MQRITRTLLKSHGAYDICCSMLRDVFFMVYRGDLEKVEEYLAKERNMTKSDIEILKRTNYPFILQYCRRVVPERSGLDSRFVRFINLFRSVKDAKTDKELFNENTLPAIDNLLLHIRANCLSDLEGVPMYRPIPWKESRGI
jgi:hypothetical protein